jgi:hypothetical protein
VYHAVRTGVGPGGVIELSLLSDELFADPYPAYRRLRNEAPCLQTRHRTDAMEHDDPNNVPAVVGSS